MPQQYHPTGQDWAVQTTGRATGNKKPTTAHGIDRAKAMGLVVTEKRYGAGGNKSAHSATALSAKKLEEADDVGTIAKVRPVRVLVVLCVWGCVSETRTSSMGC